MTCIRATFPLFIRYLLSFWLCFVKTLRHTTSNPLNLACSVYVVYTIFNCLECQMWLFELILFGFEKNRMAKGHCVQCKCTFKESRKLYQVNVAVLTVLVTSTDHTCCGNLQQRRLHISLIFEHFRNHFISVLLQLPCSDCCHFPWRALCVRFLFTFF